MRVSRSGRFQFGLLLATLLACSMLPVAGEAYTPEQQQACSGDAFRLCGPEIPDVDRVTACMVARRAELSPGCRAFFRSDPEPVAEAPPSIRPTVRKHSAPKPRKHRKSTAT